MKIITSLDRLDVHDRFEQFVGGNFSIGECCQDLINKRPFGNRSFYIFVHPRTEDYSQDKRLLWQPRLTKPSAQTNSMLFKGYPGTEVIKIIWMIPATELWGQFQYGKMTQNKTVVESIHDYKHNRAKLEAPEPDDLSDHEIARIYAELKIDKIKLKVD